MGKKKRAAPARRGKSKRPYWHSGGSLWSSFRSGRQQQDAICSAAQKGSGWIRRGRGRASWNNRLQSKSQRMPRTGCVDLKPTWLIYKFCSTGGNHAAKLGMVCGVARGNNLFSTAPPLWEPARLVGTLSAVKQFLVINFAHVRVKAQALITADRTQSI